VITEDTIIEEEKIMETTARFVSAVKRLEKKND